MSLARALRRASTLARRARTFHPRSLPTIADDARALFDAVAEGVDCFFLALATPAPLPERIRRFLPDRAADALPRPQAPQRCKLLALFEEARRASRPRARRRRRPPSRS